MWSPIMLLSHSNLACPYITKYNLLINDDKKMIYEPLYEEEAERICSTLAYASGLMITTTNY